MELSEQQGADADPKAKNRINFTDNFDQPGNTIVFFFMEKAKETIFDFSEGTMRVLKVLFSLI